MKNVLIPDRPPVYAQPYGQSSLPAFPGAALRTVPLHPRIHR